MTELQKVSTREFRNNLAQYTASTDPIAVTKHGRVVGYYFPVSPDPQEAELAQLLAAGAKLDALLQERGVSEDELVAEFRQLQHEGNRSPNP